MAHNFISPSSSGSSPCGCRTDVIRSGTLRKHTRIIRLRKVEYSIATFECQCCHIISRSRHLRCSIRA
ncbi:hypothetical protein HanRHA438_Chr14g0681221 [Helianthus annuus]|nr:hypothetical protein HanRHA438_Chr14g0681221 [Helianthus annuus]